VTRSERPVRPVLFFDHEPEVTTMAESAPRQFDIQTIQRFERLPALRDFALFTESRLGDGPEGIWDVAPALEALVCAGFASDLFRSELEHMAREPSHLPTGAIDTLLVARSRRFSLLLKTANVARDATRAHVFGLSEHVLFAVAGPAPLTIDVYSEATGYPNDVFDRERPLGPAERRTLLPGSVTPFRAGRDCPLPVSRETSFAFQLLSRPVARVQWVYDVQTHRALRAVAADPGASRLEFAAQALGELRGEHAAERLLSLCEHPDHFVRWAAIRSLTRVDLRAGVEKVRGAANDPHPHVRNAASRTLQKMAADGVLEAAAR
jgi:hypothetical protein